MSSEETTAASHSTSADSSTDFRKNLIALIPYLRAFSVTLCGRRELAEDMAQEALLKAWRAQGSYQPGTNLKAWLFTILRHEVMSYHRRAWRQIPWDEDAAQTMPSAPGEQRWSSELSDVGRALYRLPIAQRETLMLIAVEGFSYEEVAQISGAAVGTIKSRVARARSMLTAIFEQNEPLRQRESSSEGTSVEHFLAQFSTTKSDALVHSPA
jgi:RNA polymerase sigma-70 factor (ECF subfamily)